MLQSIALFLCLGAGVVFAQEPPTATTPSMSVYLDCQDFGACDFDFFRTELTMVNWVRDRQVADVHILVTTQQTGSGGREFTVTFLGLRQFAGINDTLKYVSPPASSQDEQRKGLAGIFRLGLVRYFARTPGGARLTIGFGDQKTESGQASPQKDKWKAWVYRIGVNGSSSGEEQFKSFRFGGNVSANRVTEKWKTEIFGYENYNQNEFDLDDTTTFVNIQRNYSASLLQVKSLTQHWSAGLRGSVSSSTYSNYLHAVRVLPAVEYNVFPYSQSTRRQLLLEYDIGYAHFAYRDTTIYFKTKEGMPLQRLLMTVRTRETWGSIDVGSALTSYLHDRSKYRLSTFGEFSLKLFKGFSLNGFAYYERIYDQFGLALKDFTPEEKLTRQFQLGTTYSYFANLGLSYTFGSIYNNVVNPRMGGGFFD
ncbi:MAG: hypothetical protein WD825_16525 [Gemmatimonadaceae bacterium]